MKSISLIPEDNHTVRGTIVPRNVLALIAIVLVVIIGGGVWIFSLHTSINNAKNQAENSNTNLAPISLQVSQLSAQLNSQNTTTVNISSLTNEIQEILQQRPGWANLLAGIYNLAGSTVQITSLTGQLPSSTTTSSSSASTAYDINLTGIASSQDNLVNFVQDLRHINGISRSVLLSNSQSESTNGSSAGVNFTAGIDLTGKATPIYNSAVSGTGATG